VVKLSPISATAGHLSYLLYAITATVGFVCTL